MTLPSCLGILALATALNGLAAPVARADGVGLTESEFKSYHDYLDALADPRVHKLKPQKRLPAIARNFGMSAPKLRAIIQKGERYPSLHAIGEACERSIRESIDGTSLKDRMQEIRVDTSDSHVVTYVAWRADQPEALEQEACLLAERARKAAPITADLRLWAVDPHNADHKLFDGMITGEAAGRIQEARIGDFAATRYIKLFEKVHVDRPAE